ncbi:MAG: response regulator [Dehalococcoidia bacterium]|nr:response regulator [Dehalococcoidia bacterium]
MRQPVPGKPNVVPVVHRGGPAGSSQPRGDTVLLVDADVGGRAAFCSQFEQANYTVIQADSGREALSRALKEAPDVVILESDLPDMDGTELCLLLQQGPTTRRAPVIFLSSRGDQEHVLAALEAGAWEYITKPIAPTVLVGRVHAFLKRSRQDRDANPLSGLPGGNQIRAEMEARIGLKRPFAFLYVDADSFKAFNDHYGFSRGDQAILLLATVLEETVQFLGNADDFVGHIGGDDFAIITSPTRAEPISSKIIADFDRKITALFDRSDLALGYIEIEDRLGNPVRHPLMTISIGGVTNENRHIDSYLKASEIAAEVRHRAKAIQGSSYYFDQRVRGVRTTGAGASGVRKGSTDAAFPMRGSPGDFVSSISHELLTPVTVVQNCLESLMDTMPQSMEAEQRRLLDVAYRQTKLLADTVSDLGTFDLLGQGALDLDLDLDFVDLSRLVWDALEEVRGFAEEKGIRIRGAGLTGLELMMLDRRHLSQALGHLLDNAVKFTRPRSTVTVTVTTEDSTVRIKVAATGLSIPEREMASIFRASRLVERLSTCRWPGLELGLHLAKDRAEAMGGRLEVSNVDGRGSAWSLVLPLNGRSSTPRIKGMQDVSSAAVNGVLSQLTTLGHSLKVLEKPDPKLGVAIDSLKSGIQEVEVLANRAMLLAERTSRYLEKEGKRVQWLQADLVMVIESLVSIIEDYRPFAPGMSRRVASYALKLANEAGLPRKDQSSIYCAALLHDLGMVVLPPETLTREGSLTKEELIAIQGHPKLGAGALSHIKALSAAVPLIMGHQERYDGQGYPRNLSGEDIPKGARVLAIAIAYDAMVSHRPYRPAMSPEAAKESVAAEAGKSFDPQVVEHFLHLWEAGKFQCS